MNTISQLKTARPANTLSASNVPENPDAAVKYPAEPLIEQPAQVVRKTFRLEYLYGLHCRPAAMLIRLLHGYDCEVKVEANGTVADGRSIVQLLGLGAMFGSRLTITASGKDAALAMSAIEKAFGITLRQTEPLPV